VAIGVLALGNAERAYRQAVYYANERVQGRDATGRREGPVAIIEHPDVRRMLMSMKARVEAIRHFCYYTAALIDRAERNAEAPGGASLLRRIELLTPLLKSYCSEQGFDIASLSMQVHGGTGYIEESGMPQLLRDARVHPIYEGTTGIQAIDLVTRKLARDEGACLEALLADMQTTVGALDSEPALRPVAAVLAKSIQDVRAANRYMLDRLSPNPAEALAGSVPYLNLVATTVAGWLMAQAALSAPARFSIDFIRSKQATARFFADHFLVATSGLLHTVREGAAATLALNRHYF
jgi:acyl-CoA dehydrogenase